MQKLDGTYFNTDSYQLVSRGPNGVQDGDDLANFVTVD